MYKNIKIINQNNEGSGIARIDNRVVFIPFSLSGDVINLDIVKENKKFDEGIINEIITPSIERINPLCPYYYCCGGCNLMHQKYNYQLEFKKKKVINNLKHISNIEIDNIDIEYDKDFYYRNHITLSVQNNVIGFLENHSNKIVDIKKCVISDNRINDRIDEIRFFINKYSNHNINKISIKAYDDILINIESNSFNLVNEFIEIVKCDSLFINNIYVFGKEKGNIIFNGFKYKISSKSFFQKNTNMAIKLYNYIKSNIDYNSNVLDLYCGIGSIGIYVSNKCKSVLGIEIIGKAIIDAKENALLNNINNISFISGKVEDNLDNINNIDTIIVDPPRVGLNKKAIDNILNINSNKIIYVSCNSTTLARDLNYLKEYYRLRCIKLFDLFPNTHHCESVCILERR